MMGEKKNSDDCKLYIDLDDNGEEDHRTITFELPDSKEPMASPLLRGMCLDLSFAESRDYMEEENIQESPVLVVFDLPDGSQAENEFKLGHTVEVLKSYLESEFGIAISDQVWKLYIENKHMMNPLSLLDFPETKGADEIYVRVEGEMPFESKK